MCIMRVVYMYLHGAVEVSGRETGTAVESCGRVFGVRGGGANYMVNTKILRDGHQKNHDDFVCTATGGKAQTRCLGLFIIIIIVIIIFSLFSCLRFFCSFASPKNRVDFIFRFRLLSHTLMCARFAFTHSYLCI